MPAFSKIYASVRPSARPCVCVCVLAVWNKAQAQRITKRELQVRIILQKTKSRVATFHAETCVLSSISILPRYAHAIVVQLLQECYKTW